MCVSSRTSETGHAPYARAAFTLIEVLVVVAIIAVLVAILIPSLKEAREQARAAACKANLHDFGLAMQQYTVEHDPYYPLRSYIGARIYYGQPWGDDNLFVLWWDKYTRKVETHTCPETSHKVRTPERIEKVPVPGKGLRFDIYTGGELRNDFEFQAQLVQELVQMPKPAKRAKVNGFGTSYEYTDGWVGVPDGNANTRIDWYPLNLKFTVINDGKPMTLRNVKRPASTGLMKDADEGKGAMGDVAGVSPGAATNNVPEPWDNHGARLSNVLYADGHVVSLGRGHWDDWYRQHANDQSGGR